MVKIDVPPFDALNPKGWFCELEFILHEKGITDDDKKYQFARKYIERKVQKKYDIVGLGSPPRDKYQNLTFVVSFSVKNFQRRQVENTLKKDEIKNLSPTELMEHMLQLFKGTISKSVIEEFWFDRMSNEVTTLLSSQKYKTYSFERKAKLADVIEKARLLKYEYEDENGRKRHDKTGNQTDYEPGICTIRSEYIKVTANRVLELDPETEKIIGVMCTCFSKSKSPTASANSTEPVTRPASAMPETPCDDISPDIQEEMCELTLNNSKDRPSTEPVSGTDNVNINNHKEIPPTEDHDNEEVKDWMEILVSSDDIALRKIASKWVKKFAFPLMND